MNSFPIKLPLSATADLRAVDLDDREWLDRLLWVPLYLAMPENNKLVAVQRQYDCIDPQKLKPLADAGLYAPHPLKSQLQAFELGQGLRRRFAETLLLPEYERNHLHFEYLSQGGFRGFKQDPELFIPFIEGFLTKFKGDQLRMYKEQARSESHRLDSLLMRMGLEALSMVMLGYCDFETIREAVLFSPISHPEWTEFRKATAEAAKRVGHTEHWDDALSMSLDVASLKLRNKWEEVFRAA